MFHWYDYILVGLAAMAAGAVNALAGGGTLITFPVLTAIGIPAVAANITNTVALSPGYLGATLAQMKDLRGQKERLWLYLPIGIIGGVAGGYLLLISGERIFRSLVPILILLASLLLAVSDALRSWLVRHAGKSAESSHMMIWGIIPLGLAAVYGGYFGAGMSVILLAVLGLVVNDSITRLNALKQALALSINVSAAVFFVFSGSVVWHVVMWMAGSALLGGVLGGKLASRIKPTLLRRIVVGIGITVAMVYLIR